MHILLDRDGFAKDKPVSFDDALGVIRFTLENRAGTVHETVVRVAGLPPGNYTVTSGNGGSAGKQELSVFESETTSFHVPVLTVGASVEIRRIGVAR